MRTAILAAAILFATPALAAPAPACQPTDANSPCQMTLTIGDLTLIQQAFQQAPVPYATWSPVWQKIMRQAQDQQLKAVGK